MKRDYVRLRVRITDHALEQWRARTGGYHGRQTLAKKVAGALFTLMRRRAPVEKDGTVRLEMAERVTAVCTVDVTGWVVLTFVPTMGEWVSSSREPGEPRAMGEGAT